ncbi:MAG: hypothetical protein ACJ79K_06735 [Gemmatimonadaceae bacterium]
MRTALLCRVVMLVIVLTLGASMASAQDGSTPNRPDSALAKPLPDPRAVLPERPTVATHAYTVAPGYVEIETGAQAARPAGRTQLVAPVVMKIGLARRSQLELQGGYLSDRGTGRTISGASDLGVALKQRLLDAAPIVHDFSLQATVKLATGASGVSTGTTDVSLLLISSRTLGSAELDLNAGWTRRSGDGSTIPRDASLLTASLGMPLGGRVGGVAELFAYPGTGGPAGTAPAIGFLFGPTLQLRPWLVLDAGAIVNVQAMGANAIYAGLTWNVGRIAGRGGARGDQLPPL